MLPAKSYRLADPQPGDRQELEEQTPVRRQRREQQPQLLMCERLRPLIVRDFPVVTVGDADPRAPDSAQIAVFGGGGEERRERRPQRLQLRGGAAPLPHAGEQVAHVGRLDVGEAPPPPDGQRMVGDRPAMSSLEVSRSLATCGPRRTRSSPRSSRRSEPSRPAACRRTGVLPSPREPRRACGRTACAASRGAARRSRNGHPAYRCLGDGSSPASLPSVLLLIRGGRMSRR